MKKLLLLSLAFHCFSLNSRNELALYSNKGFLNPEIACIITCPDNIIVGVNPGEDEALVTYSVGTSGCTGGAIQTAGLPSGSFFPLGTTTNCFDATDGQGNISSCCFDVTVFELQVGCPPSYEGTCGQSSNPNNTGWPTYFGNFIDPNYSCFNAVYTDNILNECGNGKQITRTWTITNTCGYPSTQCVQIIKLSDDEAPELQCPDDVEVSCATDPSEFSEDPAVFDACGSSYNIEYDDSPYLPCAGNGYTITRVYTVTDACDNSSSCAMNIDVLCRPTIQAYSIYFPTVNSTSLEVEWYPGNGSSRIVAMNTVNSFSLPPDGYDPLPNTVYDGSGEQVIYNGQGESVTVTGLLPNTTYWFRVFEASDCSGENLYLTSTANGNPKSQKTSTGGPILGDITFTNVLDPNYWNNTHTTIFTGSPYTQNKPVKICTDGTTSTYIKINSNLPNGYNFQLINEVGTVVVDGIEGTTENLAVYGKFGTPYVIGNTIEIAYTHPQYLTFTGATHVTFYLRLTYNSIPVPGVHFPIEFYRAPILFVHGLWGDGGSFNKMHKEFKQDDIQVKDLMALANYSENDGASKSFLANQIAVPYEIDKLLVKAISKKYSVSKVNIIAHSMGGLLTRSYLQGANTTYPYRNDINSIISIDSPFRGTQAANFLLNSCNNELRSTLNSLGFECDLGAIANLRADSDQIKYIQLSSHNHHNVPLYAINSTISFQEANFYDGNYDKLCLYFGYLFNAEKYNSINISNAAELAAYIYFNEAGDLIVPLSSQKGGVPLTNSPPFEYVHTYNKDGNDVIDFIEAKQTVNTQDNNQYWKGGYGSLPKLQIRNNYIVPNDFEELTIESMDSVVIETPSASDTLEPGTNLEISARGTPGIKNMIGVCSLNNDIIDVSVSDSNYLNYTILLPSDDFGEIRVYVVGIDSSGKSFNDLVKIYSIPSATLDSIRFDEDLITVSVNQRSTFTIKGYYSNGIIGNIEKLGLLEVALDDPSIAEYTAPDAVMGVNEGETKIVAKYGQITDTTSIIVFKAVEFPVTSINVSETDICLNSLVSYSLTSFSGIDSVSWYFEGGTPQYSNEHSPSIMYQDTGKFDVLMSAKLNGIWDTISILNLIDVYPLPNSNVLNSGSSSFCHGDSTILIAGEAEHFVWNNGDNSQSITVDSAGMYFVELTDSLGCTNLSDPIEITVWDPKAEISHEGDSIICAEESIVLSALVANTYLWSTGDTTQSIIVESSGVYVVTITDLNGCFANSSPSEIIQADSLFAMISSPSSNICVGDTIVLTSAPAFSYLWNTGETSNSINVFSSGEYNVIVNDQNGCSNASSSVLISVHDLPTVNIGVDTAVTSASFILDAGPNFTKYKWSTNDTTQIIVITTPGEYSITITDLNGCQASDTIKVEFITGTSSSNALQGIRLYPNPNLGVFHLECGLSNSEVLWYEIYDPMGRLTASDWIESSTGSINTMVSIPNATSGIYYLRLHFGSNSHVIKLVVF